MWTNLAHIHVFGGEPRLERAPPPELASQVIDCQFRSEDLIQRLLIAKQGQTGREDQRIFHQRRFHSLLSPIGISAWSVDRPFTRQFCLRRLVLLSEPGPNLFRLSCSTPLDFYNGIYIY